MKRRSTLHVVAAATACVLAVCCVPSSGLPVAREAGWQKVKTGKLCGISGIGMIEMGRQGVVVLIVHDNKKADQQKTAIITIAPRKKPQYTPVAWPKDGKQPVDLEALCEVPGTQNSEFLAATSKGEVLHIRLAKDRKRVEVIGRLKYPDTGGKNFEGLGLHADGTSLAAIWGHRGKGSQPGKLFWGTVDLKAGKLEQTGSSDLHVPWPEGKDLRSISDLKIGKGGKVYVSSASDPGDDGPFDSALYEIGTIENKIGKPVLTLRPKPLEIDRLPGHKIEGMVLLPGPSPVFLVGTDNENKGSSVRTVRARTANGR